MPNISCDGNLFIRVHASWRVHLRLGAGVLRCVDHRVLWTRFAEKNVPYSTTIPNMCQNIQQWASLLHTNAMWDLVIYHVTQEMQHASNRACSRNKCRLRRIAQPKQNIVVFCGLHACWPTDLGCRHPDLQKQSIDPSTNAKPATIHCRCCMISRPK